jgi:hypothetical protein
MTKTRIALAAATFLATCATTLTGTACMTDLGVRSEFDVTHEDAFAKEGEDLKAAFTENGGAFITDLIEVHSGHDGGGAYQRVGVRFDAAEGVVIEGRVGDDLGSMSAWTPLSITFSEGLAHNGHFDVAADHHGAAYVQLKASSIDALSFVAVSPIELAEADAAGGIDVAGTDDATMQALAADGIAISRSGWGARTRTCSSRHTPQRLTIHHTDTPNNDSISMAARVRQIQAYHIDNRGWCDIGYHFLVGQDGRVYQGRFENRVGSHAGGANTNNVGIAFIGSFNQIAPSGDMMAAGARMMRALADTYRITLDRTRVKGHREVGTTSTDCPGTQLFGQLSALVTLARQSGSLQPPPTTTPPPTSGRSCSSATLGRSVVHGDAVQVNYAGCGADSCGWYTCSDSAWVCGQGTGAQNAHSACAIADIEPEPISTEPDAPAPAPTGDEDVIVIDSLPFTHSADTRTLRRSNFSTYSCDPGQREGGAEAVYQLTLAQPGTLRVGTDDVPGDDVDVDVHLLQRLDPSTCLARDNVSFDRVMAAGTYFVVVDTWTTSTGVNRSGPYTLRVSFTPSAPAPGDDDDISTPNPDDVDGCPAGVECLRSASTRVNGTTVGGSRRFDRFSCSATDVSGPERVYRVVVAEEGFFSARVSGGSTGTDVDVHVLSNLSEDACLDRGNSSAGAFVAAGEVFVVVDTFVPADGSDKSGSYTLDVHHTTVSRLTGHGMTSTVARRALKAFNTAWREDATEKLTYTVIDFDQRSTARRLWTVDLATGALLQNLHVSHGIGSNHSSDAARAVRFSNVSGSNQSSLGLSRGAETYSGRHGRSLRLDGLEPGINSNNRSRAIVIHAATYATASFAASNGYLGRSHGCPAVDPARSNALIDVVRDGGLLFSHYSDATWLAQSRYLR